MKMPKYVAADGKRFRVRVRQNGRLYGKSFSTLAEAKTFAVALTVVIFGPEKIEPDQYGVPVYAKDVAEAQRVRASVDGDADALALVPGQTRRVCQHISTDGHAHVSNVEGVGKFRLMIGTGGDQYFRRLGDALRKRAATLARRPDLARRELQRVAKLTREARIADRNARPDSPSKESAQVVDDA